MRKTFLKTNPFQSHKLDNMLLKKNKNVLFIFFTLFIFSILSFSYIFFHFTHSPIVKSDKKTDSLLIAAENNSKKLNFPECILISQKALVRSREISYNDGIVRSKYWIASGLCNMAKYDKSLQFIKDIEKNHNDYIRRNHQFEFRLTDLIGRNYLALGLRKQAVREFKKELYLAEAYENPEMILKKKGRAYGQLAAVYEGDASEGNIEKSNKDSLYYYLNKAKSIFKTNMYALNNDKLILNLSLASYHIYFTKNLDSALYYNTSMLDFATINKSIYMYDVLFQRAQILTKKKKYDESLEYCFKALPIVKKLKRIEIEKAIYKLAAKNYNQLGISDKELYYINENLKIRDHLASTISSGSQISLDRIMEEVKQSKDKSNRILTTSFLLGFLALLSIIGIILIITKKQIIYKRSVINEKVKEIENLRDNKLNDAKNELIILAKENAPEFSIKFRELYPELYLKLLELHPNIKNSELTFCAYLKLNFKTKEIATYLYVTPRAVEIRKNRLRKKFNISSEQDLYIWINNIG